MGDPAQRAQPSVRGTLDGPSFRRGEVGLIGPFLIEDILIVEQVQEVAGHAARAPGPTGCSFQITMMQINPAGVAPQCSSELAADRGGVRARQRLAQESPDGFGPTDLFRLIRNPGVQRNQIGSFEHDLNSRSASGREPACFVIFRNGLRHTRMLAAN